MYSNTLVYLECWREEFSLSSMATVVDLSKGNTYLASLFLWCMMVKHAHMTILFVWCMSSAPRVFDGKRALVMGFFNGAPRVLMVNLMCARDEFARVVYF